MSDTYKTTVTNIGGEVFLSLPNDQYIQMTPEQARQIGGRLFIHAAAALGQERPDLVVLK
jgi:hypothetical protein